MQIVHKYRQINLAAWKRRQHYEVFGKRDYPYGGLTTQVDVTTLREVCRDTGHKPFTAFMYIVSDAINTVENFRYRIYEEQIILCEKVDPNFNVMNPKTELYYFAQAPFQANYADFDRDVELGKRYAIEHNFLSNNRLDVFYVSCLPWFGFTDIIQPMGLSANDTIPRIVWGQYQENNGRSELPFSITAHNGFVDALHMAKLLDRMRKLLDDPAFLKP